MHVTRCPAVLQNATTEVSRDWCSLIRVQRNLGGLANVIVTLDVVNRAVASGGGGGQGGQLPLLDLLSQTNQFC